MLEFFAKLFDVRGFAPQASGEGWTPALVSLHMASDLALWLAFVTIPLALFYYARRREIPAGRFFVLFAVFILATGVVHLLAAISMEYPLVRFAGLVKFLAAIVAWVAVIALIPVIPRAMKTIGMAAANESSVHERLVDRPKPQPWRSYVAAVVAALVAVAVRGAVDSLLNDDHVFVTALLAVVYIGWQHGFRPAIVTLVLSVIGYTYFFVPPRHTLLVTSLGTQVALAMFFFCGVACAALGESQRVARRRTAELLAAAIARQAELAQEIELRKQTEAALKASEFRFQNLVEALPQFVWSCRLDGYCDYLSPQWIDYTGVPEEDQHGDGWFDVVHPSDRPGLTAAWKAAVETQEPFDVEFRIRKHDGSYRWFGTRAILARSEFGEAEKWYGTNMDIETRKATEEALRANEARFRTLTEALPQIVWHGNADGRVVYSNRRWYEYTGIEPEQPREELWRRGIIDSADRQRIMAKYRAAIESRAEEYRDEFRLKRASDGTYRWQLAVAVPIKSDSGDVVEWVGTMTDIDDQKRQNEILEATVLERTAELRAEVLERLQAEQQVRGVAAELERSNGELEKFAYVASHDLQEPLRKILAFGDRLATKYPDALEETGKEYVDRMLNAATRMRRLIDDLLTFSRVATQQRQFAVVALDAIAADVMGDLEQRIEQTSATIRIGPLPSIRADALQMRQLFQNLLANALKFHRPDAPPEIDVDAEPAELVNEAGTALPATRIRVRDRGIGLDDKYATRIFEVFQRLHGRGEFEGTGVGLAICRKIAERHRGTIVATSRDGGGTTFTVTLPVNQATATGMPHVG